MRQRFRFRLAERWDRVRRRLDIWRQRDPQPWIVALAGMAMGLGLLLVLLTWVGSLRMLASVVKWLR